MSEKPTVEKARESLTNYPSIINVIRTHRESDFRVVFEAQSEIPRVSFDNYVIDAVRPEGGVCWISWDG